ncbi:MAG: galactose mutarotase [Rikenellaceae bacterium]|nr:galactose mutarotase [Rikenellaceae bacterium]
MSRIVMTEVHSKKAPGGKLKFYTMTNATGAQVVLTDIGAAIVSVTVPDKNGRMADVALGYRDADDYFHDDPAMGKTVGRYANRIDGARFTLDGREYHLPPRGKDNFSLHGGPEGFGNKVWGSRVEDDMVIFTLISPDGDAGYPGTLHVEATYRWSDECDLEIIYTASTDAPTVVNLTNHAYFNLAGHDAGTVLGHNLTLYASRWLPTTEAQIPTGEFAPVAGTPMDFTAAKPLGRDIGAEYEPLRIGHGYDHCWIPDGEGLRKIAVLEDPVSERRLEVYSTQPAVQVYAGNWLLGCPVSKSGYEYRNRDGVAIECQGTPDAPNQPAFPSQRLDPGETYGEKIVFSFRT